MISKNQIKYLQSLRLSKFRDQHGEFIVEGVKLVEESFEWTSFETDGEKQDRLVIE